MGAEYYLFAAFVFGLVVIILFLIFRGLKQKDALAEMNYEEKVQKLMGIYFEAEDMTNALKEYVVHVNDSIDLQLKRIEAEVKRLETIREALVREASYTAPQVSEVNQKSENSSPQEAGVPLEKKSADNRNGKVLKLFSIGKSENEIAEELSISKGEVSFILKLYMG